MLSVTSGYYLCHIEKYRAYLQKNEDVTQAPAEGRIADHETNARSALASPSSKDSVSQDRGKVNLNPEEYIARITREQARQELKDIPEQSEDAAPPPDEMAVLQELVAEQARRQAEKDLQSGSNHDNMNKNVHALESDGAKSDFDNKKTSYARPSGYRKGIREQVWENAKDSRGQVKDPLTKRIINADDNWDMGHKPGYEFRKHQKSAQIRGISRKQFLDEYNNPEHYRPELPSSNRSHMAEDVTHIYFGP